MSLLSLWTVNFLNVLSYLIPHTSWDKAEVVKGLTVIHFRIWLRKAVGSDFAKKRLLKLKLLAYVCEQTLYITRRRLRIAVFFKCCTDGSSIR
jgi:hypothetical protein